MCVSMCIYLFLYAYMCMFLNVLKRSVCIEIHEVTTMSISPPQSKN